ncbi:sensor histidine kinase [Nonomuraea sp. SBT364]|uniref:sensor histidine kinase n=1 Tax=Nonomuraea sp. SBT364 TaxID=1580530 RepID=UPI00066C762E|nr:histidine kinase [Nonomuraea sp. SBT364]
MSNAWSALRGSPFRFLTSRWPWRSLAYTLVHAVLWVPALAAVSLPLLFPFWAAFLARIERRMVRLAGFEAIPGEPRRRGLARLQQPMLWREVAFALVQVVTGLLSIVFLAVAGAMSAIWMVVAFAVLTGIEWQQRPEPHELVLVTLASLAATVALPYVSTLLTYGQSFLATTLLSPRVEELQSQVTSLARANIAELDRFEGERQRIERDLHDGTQQHLATAAMRLGMLELELRESIPAGPAQTAALESLEAVRRETELALDTLRDIVHGLRPRTLIDDGLGAALRELGHRMPVSATVEADGVGRLPLPVESSLYYIASEAVTNAVKHAYPERIRIELAAPGDRIVMTITDDGLGGASSARGTGIVGMYERATMLSGDLLVDSPPGGPTRIVADIPRPR